jgi:hypothetical protein
MMFGPKVACGRLGGRLHFTFHDTWRAARIRFIRAGFAPKAGFSEQLEVVK